MSYDLNISQINRVVSQNENSLKPSVKADQNRSSDSSQTSETSSSSSSCEGVKKMRVKNFGDDFMEVPKIGNLKSFTLSCNARNFSSKNPYNPKSSVLSQKCWKNGSALNTYKTQINAI
ncbi:hypothetical protein [Campylobacter hyointestinalis]|uniref:hypothetical protein n=1 Tax=Campylobacter hyointestinalis TaxID=198 RepID=UPI00072582ED|nr:hypothetical protein [Campylobacter hyointestinalis]CUU82000.1 Uncharacterised protein [Campylobacter hyointestinalis subsp. hyointestinalis]